MSIKPLFDRVAIRRDEPIVATTASGLILPGSTVEVPNTGVAVAVGPGRTLDSGETLAMVVQVGDRVSFGHHSATNIVKVDGEELIIINESELIAVLS